MKTALLVMGGLFAGLAALKILQSRREQPVEELAHKLEAAWANNHTVV